MKKGFFFKFIEKGQPRPSQPKPAQPRPIIVPDTNPAASRAPPRLFFFLWLTPGTHLSAASAATTTTVSSFFFP